MLVIPLAAGFGVAVLAAHLIGHPHGALRVASWWIAVLGASTLAVLIVDSQSRRLLPLAALLRLSLVFPDRAPSRFSVALRAGSVGRLAERAQTVGDTGDAGRAARQILILAGALARHDTTTRGHSERVRAFTDLLAEELNLSEAETDRLRWSALLHDVGKLTVAHGVLNKRGALDDTDWEVLRRHPQEGARIARPLRKWLGSWALAIAQHHERWDGSGYPRGLAGKKIARAARIVAVADAFDVMTAARSYKRPVRPDAARRELAACAEKDFDPEVVRAFLDISVGRLRWALGIGAILALPALPRDVTRPIRAAAAGATATLAGLALGVLPLQATAHVATQVLGESFQRPSLAPAPPSPSPPGTDPATPSPAIDPPTTTTAAVSATPTTISTAGAAAQAGASAGPGATAGGSPGFTPAPGAAPLPRSAPTPSQPGPVAVDDVVAGIVVVRPTRIPVLANDHEAGGTLLPRTLSIVVAPRHGSAHVDGAGQVHYKPNRGYSGPDSLTYAVC
ncbi:MAG: domain/HD domain protein, partial [Acidimicrobiales bacterium]|nr:domain/HD domain protein [Acidimicrobiales bacterium]